MKPINRRDRKRAFWNFLFLFLTTMTIMATCVFFSTKVPFRENDKLRNEIALIDQQRSTATLITQKLEQTILLLDSINLAGVQPEAIESEIDDNIRSMKSLIRNDSTIAGKSIYNYAIDNCQDLKIAKKQLREISHNDQALANLQRENSELNARLQISNNELQSCQMILYSQQKR